MLYSDFSPLINLLPVIRPWAGFVIGLMASLISYGAVIVKTRVGWDDALGKTKLVFLY